MTEDNELLNEDIDKRITNARRELPQKEKESKPIFYMIVIFFMTIAVLYNLFKQFF